MTQPIYRQITYEEIDSDHHYVIDVRSPSEYSEFHIPESTNLPLFTDEERKMIGTIYKQESKEKAKREGIAIYSGKLPGFYDKWLELARENPGKTPVITCARGGMRSGSFVSIMQAMKMPVFQLRGGIREARKHVQAELGRLGQLEWKTVVLGGLTGTGKTKWLLKLKDEGYPVVDLEGLANHRGSLFGHIGLERRTQKHFEFELAEALKRCEPFGTMIIEAESKRIGNIIIPDFILSNKKAGHYIELRDSIDRRVKHIIEEYDPANHTEQFIEATERVTKRMPAGLKEEITGALEKGEYEEYVALLLEKYYDPKYNHKENSYVKDHGKSVIDASPMAEDEITGAIREEIDMLMKN